MKELSKVQTFIFALGTILLLAGLLMWKPFCIGFAPYLVLAGALMVAFMQLQQQYEGRNFIIRRLRRQQLAGAFFLILTGMMMVASLFHVPYTMRNEWIIALTIGCLFELYTSFRIPAELKKEEGK